MNISRISHTSLVGRALRLPMRLLPSGTVVPIVSGTLRGYRWIVGSSIHGCWLGTYEQRKQRLVSALLRPGSVFLDIGANVGFYSLLAVRCGCRVISFEPLSRNVRYLKQHLRINGITNVDVVEAAVCETNGTARFHADTDPSQASLDARGDVLVSTVALDAMDIPTPHFIKMDIEGAEFRALQGAQHVIKRARPTIFLATHGTEVHRNCCELLADWGYTISQIGAPDELLAIPGLDPVPSSH